MTEQNNTNSTFRVGFGKYARSVAYEDTQGAITFTFDIAGDDGRELVLEHLPERKQTHPNYSMAYARSIEFLTSRGYFMRSFGSLAAPSFVMNPEDVERLIQSEIYDSRDQCAEHMNLLGNLLLPVKQEFFSDQPGDKWLLWKVCEESGSKLSIVFDDNSRQFGLAKRQVFLGFWGSFLQTVDAVTAPRARQLQNAEPKN